MHGYSTFQELYFPKILFTYVCDFYMKFWKNQPRLHQRYIGMWNASNDYRYIDYFSKEPAKENLPDLVMHGMNQVLLRRYIVMMVVLCLVVPTYVVLRAEDIVKGGGVEGNSSCIRTYINCELKL